MRERLRHIKNFIFECRKLLRPVRQSKERNKILVFLAVAMLFNLLNVYMTVRLNIWSKNFFNALENKDAIEFINQLGILFLLAGVSLFLFANQKYLCSKSVLVWRSYMSDYYTHRWLSSKCYYSEIFIKRIDNPDQRIAEDLRIFPTLSVTLLFDFVDSVSSLGAFAIILWNLSEGYTIFGVVIPGSMLWIATSFVFFGTYIVHKIGSPLIALDRKTQEYEADYRYNLLRLRECAKEISMYDGQEVEKKGIVNSFAHVFNIWLKAIRKKRQLSYFNFGYGQISGVVPYLMAAPKYFDGLFKMGEMMQTVSAFNGVRVSLSWFILNYGRLSEWKAAADRLIQYDLLLDEEAFTSSFQITEYEKELVLKDVAIKLPDGKLLTNSMNLTVAVGEKVVLTGASGAGKSTLFHVLRGLWPFGEGKINMPATDKLFFSQKPYLPLGNLYKVLAYPKDADILDREIFIKALKSVELEHLCNCAEVEQNWEKVLSPGEQQRISLGRIWVHNPQWVFLDEALSSVDNKQRERLLQRLNREYPDLSVLGIEHYGAESSFYDRRVVWNEWMKAI